MRGRANINEEHIEHDERDNRAWIACRAERELISARWSALAREIEDVLDQYTGMCWEYGLRDASRNGVQGSAHAHGVWRLHRTTLNSAKNAANKLEEL